MTPILTCDLGEAELTCDVGVMRLLIHGAMKDADLWARSNASSELKQQWARRAAIIRGLHEQLPPPANPRDPYEDLPNEPTPEEAEARWRERAAAEDARRDVTRVIPEKVAEPDSELEVAAAAGMLEPDEDLLGLL